MRRRQLLLAAIVVSAALGFTGSLPNLPDTWGFAIGSAGLLLG